MRTTVKSLYDTDFAKWADHTAELLRQRRLDEVEMEHLIEEIEDLGKNQRSAVRSQLHRMLMHLVKEAMQPERRGRSWRESISNSRTEIRFNSRIHQACAESWSGNWKLFTEAP